MNETIISFDRHIMNEQRKHEGRGDFSAILSQIIFAAKVVAAQVSHAGLIEDILGRTGEKNIQGEEVQKLDLYANKVFINSLKLNTRFSIPKVSSSSLLNSLDTFG